MKLESGGGGGSSSENGAVLDFLNISLRLDKSLLTSWACSNSSSSSTTPDRSRGQELELVVMSPDLGSCFGSIVFTCSTSVTSQHQPSSATHISQSQPADHSQPSLHYHENHSAAAAAAAESLKRPHENMDPTTATTTDSAATEDDTAEHEKRARSEPAQIETFIHNFLQAVETSGGSCDDNSASVVDQSFLDSHSSILNFSLPKEGPLDNGYTPERKIQLPENSQVVNLSPSVLVNSPTNQKAKMAFPRDESGKFVCPMCHKTFQFNAFALRHYRAVHTNIRYTCDLCGSKQSQKDNLKTHLIRVHCMDGDSAKSLADRAIAQ